MKGSNAKKWKLLRVLFELAKLRALDKSVKISTKDVAAKLSCSQQTASRLLILLEKMKWIERSITARGEYVRISRAGRGELEKVHAELCSLLERLPALSLEGEIFTGLKEGAYYVSQEGYRKQFVEKLGFDPYPGTLNLKLKSDSDLRARKALNTYPCIEIEGFSDKSRTFGPAKCYRVLINDEELGAIVTALRTHYDETVVELIAPIYLRERFKLKDGDIVRVKLITSST